MGLFFQKFIDEFETSPSSKIYNKRIISSNMKVLKKIDLTFRSSEVYQPVNYQYLENLSALKQLLPVPEFLLKPLGKYNLHYETKNSEIITFNGKKTVIYLHGVGVTLLKPYKIFKKIVGSKKSAERIRRYVTEFIFHSDVLEVKTQDHLIKNND